MTSTVMAPLFSRRVLAAGLSYTAFGLFAPAPALISLILGVLPIGSAKRQSVTRKMIQGLCRVFTELMQLLGLYTYTVEREYRETPSGKLIVANHPTLLDAIFVMAFIPDVCCITKPVLANNIFTGLTLRQAGFVVADDPNLMTIMAEKLARGENVLIFPEGTRNASDLDLHFRRGAANLAVTSGCEVLPIILECHPRALQKGESWYQVPADRAKIGITICNPLKISECIDVTQARTLQYRRLTSVLVDLYLRRLTPQGYNPTIVAGAHSAVAIPQNGSNLV